MTPLDRPILHALRTRHAHLALGQGAALRYRTDHAVFAAGEDEGQHSLSQLAQLIRSTGPAILMQASASPVPPGLTLEKSVAAVQMLAGRVDPPANSFDFVELGDPDAPDMRELTALTQPGPFFERTHQLGGFIGIRVGGRLVAMAGERLQLPGYSEVSAVCTHPDHRGRGHAGALMRIVAGRILARGETPILHSFADNRGAIALYETLGFRYRSDMIVSMLASTSA